jgi:hypothetical protein
MAESGEIIYQWATLFMPLSVDPEFTSQVWKAVQERTGTGGDAWTLKEWCKLCQERSDPA